MVYSTSGDACDENVHHDLKISSVLKMSNFFNRALIWHQMWKDHMQIIHQIIYSIIVTQIMTSQDDDLVGHLYSFINEISTFFIITLKRMKTWSSHFHDDVIKWKHFPRYWPFVWGIHRSPHKGHSPEAWWLNLAMFGNNPFFAFLESLYHVV